MDNKTRQKRLNRKWEEEEKNNEEACFWMSFADPDKLRGSQFLGVIIIKAKGFLHAVDETHKLGINPSGEIQSTEIDPDEIKPEHFNKLLSKKQLEEAGYI